MDWTYYEDKKVQKARQILDNKIVGRKRRGSLKRKSKRQMKSEIEEDKKKQIKGLNWPKMGTKPS